MSAPMKVLSTEKMAALLRQDYYSFAMRCFFHLHPQTKFFTNWHLRLMASQLSEVKAGEITRLLINLPPRNLKSVWVSVAFVAWYLGHFPWKKVITASYGLELAEKHARDCLAIM